MGQLTDPAIQLLLWEAGLQFLAVLLAGVILGLFASVYLKKRDDVTRVAGVILEKRVNSHQEILAFFEDATYTLQVPSDRASPLHELIQSYGLEAPWGANLQYGEIFESVEKFHGFQRQLEKLISQHKLWLDAKVGFHLNLILAYFSWINMALVTLQKIELPGETPLKIDAYQQAAEKLLFIQGIVLDAEFKGLVAELETLMVDSIYHLDLRRSRFSLMRNGFWNRDSRKLLKILSNKTLLGEIREVLMAMSVSLVAASLGRTLKSDEVDAVVDGLGARHQ